MQLLQPHKSAVQVISDTRRDSLFLPLKLCNNVMLLLVVLDYKFLYDLFLPAGRRVSAMITAAGLKSCRLVVVVLKEVFVRGDAVVIVLLITAALMIRWTAALP